VPGADARGFAAALAAAVAAGDLALDRDRVALPGREVRPGPEEARALERLEAEVRAGGFSPPTVAELTERLGRRDVEELVFYLQEQGRVVRLASDFVIHAEHLAEARERVRAFLQAHGRMTVAEFRDLLQTSRKYALPLLEHFDTARWTRRVGDDRMAGPAL